MSLYCHGTICDKKEKCLRATEWDKFPNKEIAEGFGSGVWFVSQHDCIRDNYNCVVFEDAEDE